MLQPEELKLRLDAIRTLRGLRQSDLAKLVEADGHGKHDVGRLERADMVLTPSLRRSLAHHLKVSEQWFTEPDMDRILAPDGAQDGAEQLDRIETLLVENQQLLLALTQDAGLISTAHPERSWASFARLREALAAQAGPASRPAPPQRRTSTG